jgi:hypothetical protein
MKDQATSLQFASIALEYFVAMLHQWFAPDAATWKQYAKVRAVLYQYANAREIALEALCVSDIYETNGEICESLYNFIRGLSETEKYRGEHLSRLRGIGKALAKAIMAKNEADESEVKLVQVPPALEMLLDYLPRKNGSKCGSLSNELNLALRRQLPFTKASQQILKAILKVSPAINTTEELFQRRMEVYATLRKIVLAKEYRYCQHHLIQVFYRMGFSFPPQARRSVPFESWPSTLKEEFLLFVERATKGVDQSIQEMANRYKFSVELLTASSIERCRDALSSFLGAITYPTTLSLEDLLKLEERDEVSNTGEREIIYFNSMIDTFRRLEQAKETPHKRAGRDSVAFAHLIDAVVAMAARLGHGKKIKKIHEAYVIFMDEEAMEAHKEKKRELFSISWMDCQIEKMYREYKQIIKTKSFQQHTKQGKKDLAFICFFVQLVTLRYMGYRQQCLVRARLNEHITLLPNGMIDLDFPKNKNRKPLHFILSEERRETHGLLLDTLTLYIRQVHPYLQTASGNTLNDFFYVSVNKGKTRPFSQETRKGAARFNKQFKDNLLRFFDLREFAPEDQHLLHPHFFRGLCCDWLKIVLNRSDAQIAEYVGDSEAMIRKRYLNKNRVYDGGHSIDVAIAEKKLVRQSQGKEKDGENEQLRQNNAALQKELAAQRELFENLLKGQQHMFEQFKEETAELKRQNQHLHDQIASFYKQFPLAANPVLLEPPPLL